MNRDCKGGSKWMLCGEMLAAIITCVVVWDIPSAMVWKLFSRMGVGVDIQIIKSAVLMCMLLMVVWFLVVRKLGIFQALILFVVIVLLIAGQISMWRYSKQFGPVSVEGAMGSDLSI
jgi:hypothetical protein